MDPMPVPHCSRTPRLLRAAAVACATLAAVAAHAHEAHGTPQHGGIVAEAGTFQGELVGGPNGPTLYVTEHGRPLPTAGGRGKLVVMASGQRSELALAPAGENRLAPAQSVALPKGGRAVVTVTLGDGRSGALRFDVK